MQRSTFLGGGGGAGETFFPVVLLCQFLVPAGNRFWFYIRMHLEYNTVVVRHNDLLKLPSP
jgi:hypothetical protein